MNMSKMKLLKTFVFLTLGAIIAGVAIEGFLVPNEVIDGGVVGISIMCNTITGMKLGLFTFFLNLPFILLALKKFGKMFVLSTLYSITIMSLFFYFIHVPAFTNDLPLASIFGGLALGTGVGLILRNNGSLDGTEIVSILLAKKTAFSVGEIIMFINIFIFTAAGFLYGWNNAMYSMLTYFIAYRVIDIVLEGLNESKSINIISDKAESIGQAIIEKMDTSVTYLSGYGGYSGAPKKVIYCVTSRLELVKLKEIVKELDPQAFIAVENVHEVDGVMVRARKGLH